jgi:hypothetical protein
MFIARADAAAAGEPTRIPRRQRNLVSAQEASKQIVSDPSLVGVRPDHHGAGGKELLKLMLTWTCSKAAVNGAMSSSDSGSKNRRRTKAT